MDASQAAQIGPGVEDFGMHSDEANQAVARWVDALAVALDAGVPREGVMDALAGGFARLAETYPEVGDTVVRASVIDALESYFVDAGYDVATDEDLRDVELWMLREGLARAARMLTSFADGLHRP